MGHCSRGFLETVHFKSNPRGVEKNMFMTLLHPYGKPLVSDNSAAPGTAQGWFFIRKLRILVIGSR